MRPNLALILFASLLTGCGAAAPSGGTQSDALTPGPFTSTQIKDCAAAIRGITDYDLIITGPQDVAAERRQTLSDIESDLQVIRAGLSTPTAAQPEWSAFVTALQAAETAFAKAMTLRQYGTAYHELVLASLAWRAPCQDVAKWADENTAS